MLSFKVMA